jgi:hypothetical protein
MKRRFLIGSVLTLMLLCCTLFAGSPAAARRCPFDMCVSLYNECEASCNGNRTCLKACQRDYNECLCSNCGFDCGDLPRAAPQARTSRAAVSPGTANGYAPTFPADTFFQRGRAVP